MLSRSHARLRVDAGRLVLEDRGSRNGTFVKVSGASLVDHGSEFRISTRRYRFEVDPEGAVRDGAFRPINPDYS